MARATRQSLTPERAAEALDRLLAAIPRASWFAALGDPFSDGEEQDAAQWLKALGFAHCRIERAKTWKQARRIAADPQWDRRWWAAEEDLRAALLRTVEKSLGRERAMEQLSDVTLTAHDATIGAAARAAGNAGVADAALSAAAAGAATQACYQGALALLAGAGPGHAFSAKLALFLGGRWPLGILRGRAYIF